MRLSNLPRVTKLSDRALTLTLEVKTTLNLADYQGREWYRTMAKRRIFRWWSIKLGGDRVVRVLKCQLDQPPTSNTDFFLNPSNRWPSQLPPDNDKRTHYFSKQLILLLKSLLEKFFFIWCQNLPLLVCEPFVLSNQKKVNFFPHTWDDLSEYSDPSTFAHMIGSPSPSLIWLLPLE